MKEDQLQCQVTWNFENQKSWNLRSCTFISKGRALHLFWSFHYSRKPLHIFS